MASVGMDFSARLVPCLVGILAFRTPAIREKSLSSDRTAVIPGQGLCRRVNRDLYLFRRPLLHDSRFEPVPSIQPRSESDVRRLRPGAIFVRLPARLGRLRQDERIPRASFTSSWVSPYS